VPPSRKPSKINPYHERTQRQVEYDEKGEYSPDELKSYQSDIAYNARTGKPPPPPLPPKKPLVQAKLPPEDEPKK
jgi:hypothetical protein